MQLTDMIDTVIVRFWDTGQDILQMGGGSRK